MSKTPGQRPVSELSAEECLSWLKDMRLQELPQYTKKYRPYSELFQVELKDRTWPGKTITTAPRWCSVDLRDGNQALINPMNLEQKLEMFRLLVAIGIKEIEIGFPSAAAIEFEFTRTLIEKGLVPDDVLPQVLTQARSHLIDKTFESLKGARAAIVHLYNSTSELQRRVVFQKDRQGIAEIAVEATKRVKALAQQTDTKIHFEYSPESFTGTELEFAFEICLRVLEVWEPSAHEPMIINLPSTVEMTTPNVYADQIEWFLRALGKERDKVVLSLHTHNDRGTGVAATELGLLAGADRVEGTLFGNGERTGNVDIVTVALNMYSQGVHPNLRLSDLNAIKSVAERCTQLPIPERHPYAGELVFTAFSGSHQDAIRKGMNALEDTRGAHWEVPYLPIDPSDIGRAYEPIIRINSQSGKGGVAFIMESSFGFMLPKPMHPEFSSVIQRMTDETGREVSSKEIWQAFSREYLEARSPYGFIKLRSEPLDGDDDQSDMVKVRLSVETAGATRELIGQGNGPIDACKDALFKDGCQPFKLTHFSEHALSAGTDAEAAAYIQIEFGNGRRVFGVGQDANTTKASIKALLSAINRAL